MRHWFFFSLHLAQKPFWPKLKIQLFVSTWTDDLFIVRIFCFDFSSIFGFGAYASVCVRVCYKRQYLLLQFIIGSLFHFCPIFSAIFVAIVILVTDFSCILTCYIPVFEWTKVPNWASFYWFLFQELCFYRFSSEKQWAILNF